MFLAVGVLLTVRWILWEPYVIPSGSMIPTLLIKDHIFVAKFWYGLRLPFTEKYLIRWKQLKRGDIVVFRYPKDPSIFYVKRIVAVGGDEIAVENGLVHLAPHEGGEKQIWPQEFLKKEDEFDYYRESPFHNVIRYEAREQSYFPAQKVPEGEFFVMGDNRDESSDSRMWGTVPERNVLGAAQIIWLSCENSLPDADSLCDPRTIRWNRIFKTLH